MQGGAAHNVSSGARIAPDNVIVGNRTYENQDSGIQINSGSHRCLLYNNRSWNNGDHVMAALHARGLTGSSLVIELTESALLTDPDIAGAVLCRLRAAGVGIAIDDFGAGYASLLYLRRYPVSMLKLDRSLVHGLSDNATDAALVRWTVEMAHSLGLTCVAEGVENAATFQALADLGCDEAQGFYLQAPGPGPEMVLSAFTRQTVPVGPR